MSVVFKLPKLAIFTCELLLMFSVFAGAALGQSTDINFPSPVRTSEVIGSIAARDLGDARRTDHFYAFVGNPGDLLITIQSNNLNGDVDVFTTGTLRPLMKFTLYAESSLPITKSVYLRRRQDLVLRVEARTPNDDEGTYQIRFGGSFEPIAGESLLAANENPAPDTTVETSPARGKNTKRVSSVGARLPEPLPSPTPVEEIAAATPTPEPTPEPTPVESPSPTAAPERAAETEARAPEPRRTRGRGATGRRRSTPPAANKEETTTAGETTTNPKAGEAEATTAPAGRRTGRRGATQRTTESPQEPEPQTGPRLIIEMQDGTRIERYMSTLKRVTVENNQIVVVNKLGRIERVRLSEVARMSIEP
jgi:hypothetical protein